jgi:hypothetical protein
VEVRITSEASPDPHDNAFCACAEQGRAAFLVTLNPKDFPQNKLLAKVISPSDTVPTTARRRRPSSLKSEPQPTQLAGSPINRSCPDLTERLAILIEVR